MKDIQNLFNNLYHLVNYNYNFEESFIKPIKPILNIMSFPPKKQGLLTNGYQTYGNLFDAQPT